MLSGLSRDGGVGLGAVAVLVAGCSDLVTGLNTSSLKPTAEKVNEQFVPGVPKGYQCPLVPNGFDPAGSIYRVDSGRHLLPREDFSTDPVIATIPNFKREVPISNYVLTDTQQSNAGMSVDLLQKVVPGSLLPLLPTTKSR